MAEWRGTESNAKHGSGDSVGLSYRLDGVGRCADHRGAFLSAGAATARFLL